MRQRLCLFMKICEPHASARRVQRRAQRGGKGLVGKTKKSRLAIWRARDNFLVVPTMWRRGRDSNPRWLLTTHTRFPSVHIRPL